jgi:hypothetical protein
MFSPTGPLSNVCRFVVLLLLFCLSRENIAGWNYSAAPFSWRMDENLFPLKPVLWVDRRMTNWWV